MNRLDLVILDTTMGSGLSPWTSLRNAVRAFFGNCDPELAASAVRVRFARPGRGVRHDRLPPVQDPPGGEAVQEEEEERRRGRYDKMHGNFFIGKHIVKLKFL